MAAASSSMSGDNDMLSSIMDLVTCSLCEKRDLSSILKVLTCFHSACSSCLNQKLRNVPLGSKFKCPGCSNVHTMPANGIDGFGDNTFSVNIKFLSGILSNNPPKCYACEAIGEDASSATYCLLCQKHFCEADGRKHMATSGHEVVIHGELCSSHVLPKLLSANSGKCVNSRIHEEPKPFQHYCTQCKTLSCGECLSYEHEGHKKMPLRVAGDIYRVKLKEIVAATRKEREEKKKQKKAFKNELDTMVQNKETTAKIITAYGDRLKKFVDELIKEELDNLDKESTEAEGGVKKAIDQVSNDEKQLDVATVHLETFLQNSSDVNVVLKYESFEKNLQECRENVEDLKHTENKTFPVDFMIEADMNRKIQQMIVGRELKDCGVIESPFRDCADYFFVDHKYKEVISYNDDIMEILGREWKEIAVVDDEDISFKFGSLPAAHGHLLYVCDDGKEVVVIQINGKRIRTITLPKEERKDVGIFKRLFGKVKQNDLKFGLAFHPFTGDLYISSTATNTIYKCLAGQTEPERCITTSLNGPLFSCVIPNRGVVVSNIYSHEVHLYDFRGTLLWKYGREGSGNEEFNKQVGVCADHLDNIFVADCGNKRLHYISSDGRLLKHLDVLGYPMFIGFMNNRLFITVIDENGKDKLIVLKCNYV